MTRKFTSLLILTLLTVAMVAVSANASRTSDMSFDKVKAYGFSARDTEQTSNTSKGGAQISLGTHSNDGDSPGYIIGRTMRDRQDFYKPGHTVAWRNTPNIHFGFIGQYSGCDDYLTCALWGEYTMYDPTTAPNGVWLTNVLLHPNPYSHTGRAIQLDVDTTGHAVPACEFRNPQDEDQLRNCEFFWDVAGPGAYGTFIGDTLPNSLSGWTEGSMASPIIEIQHYNGQIITHCVAMDNGLGYWRRVGDNPVTGGWERNFGTQELDWSWSFALTASQVDGQVAILWLDSLRTADEANVVFVESDDGGVTWPTVEERTSIINIDATPGASNWLPWCEVDGMYDTDGFLHIVYNTMQVIDAASQGIDPVRLFHWTDRVAGDNAGGKLSLVAIADFDGLGHMCGRAGYNTANLSKGVISQCDTNLVIMWQQLGDLEAGDTLDCPVQDGWDGYYNADLYVSISLTLDGTLWDKGRNITNSTSPDCDTAGNFVNSCDHDTYASASRYAMNVADMGTTYWSAVPEAFEVRDVLAPGYPEDGWYVDVQFLNDLYPENASWMDNHGGEELWTYNPMKWFRLPCADPIIQPQIVCSADDFLSPTNWVKSGQDELIDDVAIENIGNAALTITDITADVTTGTASWVSISSIPTTVPAGSVEYFDVILNPTGIVTTQEALEADIIITSDDPDRGTITAFSIRTVIADTVVQIIWDTVKTSANFALTVANQGSAGRSGWGNANMDFVYTDSTGPECSLDTLNDDATEHVYFYDASPIIMYDGTGDPGTYSWSPFWIPARAAAYNFVPVSDAVQAQSFTTSAYDGYRTNTFVTSDSTLGCTKTWYAPASDVSFVVEKWEVYSYGGGSVTAARFGEWIDWDIPSGTDGNQGGGAVNADHVDYVFQQGILDPTADPVACLDPERRFGGSGLLGHYYTSEREIDPEVYTTGLYGGFVNLDGDLFEEGSDQLIVDSVWAWLGRNVQEYNNSAEEDQQVLLSYGEFDIVPNDTLCIWTVHATIYDGEETDLQAVMDAAEAWFYNTHVASGCCGAFSDGTWPTGYTGNTNCSDDGKRTLSDITKLIDNVYISKEPLCCYASGNTNGSWDDGECKITLSDITKLIDAVYISKELTEACNKGCER